MTVFAAPEGFEPLDDTKNVYKKIITAGTGAKCGRTGSTVQVHYTGSLFSNGEVFDSSIERGEPISFKIGQGQVVKGWDVGISSMNIGEHAELLIQPEYGYGKNGSPPKIPGDSVLLFKVELVGVDESTADLTIPEKISKAQELKEKGNVEFKASNFKDAVITYNASLNYLENTFGADPEDSETVKNLKVSLHSNLAACQLKTNDASDAVKNAVKVLEIDPTHSKATYRFFKATLMLGNYDEAIAVLEKSRKILVDVNVDNEILRAKKLKQAQLAKEKKMYANLWGQNQSEVQ